MQQALLSFLFSFSSIDHLIRWILDLLNELDQIQKHGHLPGHRVNFDNLFFFLFLQSIDMPILNWIVSLY